MIPLPSPCNFHFPLVIFVFLPTDLGFFFFKVLGAGMLFNTHNSATEKLCKSKYYYIVCQDVFKTIYPFVGADKNERNYCSLLFSKKPQPTPPPPTPTHIPLSCMIIIGHKRKKRWRRGGLGRLLGRKKLPHCCQIQFFDEYIYIYCICFYHAIFPDVHCSFAKLL